IAADIRSGSAAVRAAASRFAPVSAGPDPARAPRHAPPGTPAPPPESGAGFADRSWPLVRGSLEDRRQLGGILVQLLAPFVEPLAQVMAHLLLLGDGQVGLRVAAGHVGADTEQVASLLVARPVALEALRQLQVLGADHLRHHPADGGLDFDGRV